MKIDEARAAIRKLLPDKRFRHSLGVSETAGELAERFGADPEKAKLAGMLHDIAKYFSDRQLAEMIRKRTDYPDDCLNYSDKLWHSPAGAIYVEETFGIVDPDILHAIRYHTTGRPQMSLLEKIIFLADYIEPGRDIPAIDEVRRAAETDLNEACFLELQRTIIYLLQNRQRVYPLTFEAYNDFAKRKNTNEVTE
ncbi:MAG: bis(5'-nucleosyl)-tetraphosphatase (symmetrical) YqeK [Sporolactobacillus sp.]|jgi:predicted HD superfamily hydrolase involved in NAD metabolism|nr:bis(5'-nucleosyl)-tetraphosphatase (symmetrical) YqeK [Sporolactobacillus sp.]